MREPRNARDDCCPESDSEEKLFVNIRVGETVCKKRTELWGMQEVIKMDNAAMAAMAAETGTSYRILPMVIGVVLGVILFAFLTRGR